MGVVLAFNASPAYLLLILREGLVFLEKLWDVGLVGYFEHGDSLDGHFDGGACGDIAINGASEECEECRIAHKCVKETTRKHGDMCGIYLAHGLTVTHVPVSVSTVWTSRLVINYLKTIGSPYRREVGFGTVQLLFTSASSILRVVGSW